MALSQRPEDPRHPLVHRDAKPVPLLKETRAPWPAKPGPPPRDEDADERGGTATVLVLTEPRTGWRTDRHLRTTAGSGRGASEHAAA